MNSYWWIIGAIAVWCVLCALILVFNWGAHKDDEDDRY
jgi:hypothetical protein